MTAKVKRRTALAAAIAMVGTRRAAAQEFKLTSVLSELISTAGDSFGVTYPVKPKGTAPFPTVIVLAAEETSGVATDALDRLTKEGIFAVAPDVFLDDPIDEVVMNRIDATCDWAGKNGGDMSRLGIVGFGSGGRAAWIYDARSPTLKAVIAWYGSLQGETSQAHPTTALDAASKLNAPLLGLYGKNDGTPQHLLLDAEARAKKAGKIVEVVSYVGVGRDFAAPGSSFDQAATLDGWQRTTKWLRDHGVA